MKLRSIAVIAIALPFGFAANAQAQGSSADADAQPGPSSSSAPSDPAADPSGSPAADQSAQAAPPPEPSEISPADAADVGVVQVDTAPSEPAATAEPARTAERKSSSRLVEEIIVTAQKREENLQDVPISVNAFSSEVLDARGIVEPRDLPLATPGLTMGTTAGYTVTYLRGVGSDAFLLADPSVALYIDGVYFPAANGLAQNFGGVERIEVLKGPQGTLFGRNAVGGAISIITKSPKFDAPEVSLQASYGSFNDLQTRAHVNLPLTDTFAMSLSALYNNTDSYIEDGRIQGRPLPDENSRGARLKFRWAPTESLDFTLAGFRLLQQGSHGFYAPNSDPSLLAYAAGVRAQDGFGGEADAPVYYTVSNRVIYGQGQMFTDWFDVKLIASDQYIYNSGQSDFDGSSVPLVAFEGKGLFADVQTAELQIISNDSSWGSDWFKWIGGFYYFQSDQGIDPVYLEVGGLRDRLGTIRGNLSGMGLAGPVLGQINSVLDSIGLLPTGAITATGIVNTESSAVFAQTTFDFTDWLALTLGVRYQSEDRYIVESTAGFGQDDGSVVLIPGQNYSGKDDPRFRSNTTSTKPKISLDLRPWDDTLVYLTYQEALKSGAYNIVNIYDAPDYVKPEELKGSEVGIKTAFFGGLVTLASAVFKYDITNLQVQFVSLAQGGAVTFENAGGAEVKGIDFDTTAVLFPDLIDGLVVTAGGAFLDAKYTDYRNGSGFSAVNVPGFGNAKVLTTGNDFTGNRITRTPKFSGTVSLSKTTQIPSGPLEIAADVYYNSGFFYLAENTDFNEENAYKVVSARISYLYEPWNARFTVFGKNILDEDYNYSRFTNDFGALDAQAAPAAYGVRINVDF